MKKWIVLQHVPWEGPGLITKVGRERGIGFEIVRLDIGDRLPPAAAVDGLVVMGGPMGVYEVRKYAWIRDEQSLIGECARAGKPVFGVCLGAQLIAAALGGRVFKGPRPEVGLGEATLTPDGVKDPVLGPGSPIPVFHWHSDTFDLPPRTLHLARSPVYATQAFRFGTRTYGLQFHIEADADLAKTWTPHLPDGIKVEEPYRQGIEKRGIEILNRYFEVVRSSVPSFPPEPKPEPPAKPKKAKKKTAKKKKTV